MPSTSERITALERRLLSPERFVDALLEVRTPEGETLFRTGGRWDRHLKRYVGAEHVLPHVVELKQSQVDVGRGFARWLDACRRGDASRPRVIMAGGNRGSGKTWFLAGVALAAVALEWPGCWQLAINILVKHRRECLAAMRSLSNPKWIARDVADFRDPFTEFITGSMVQWLSSQNPRAIRQAGLPIRHVMINEGQDQPETVFTNAISAMRNTGGFLSVATNPPQVERGDWVAAVWLGIEAEELRGERYLLDNKLNSSVDQEALVDIAGFLRAVNQESAEADAEGKMHLSGPVAYAAFSSLPVAKGGHVGEPPLIGWTDATRELSGAVTNSDTGYDYVCGVDFQRKPGIIGSIAKLYKNKRGEVVLWIYDSIGVRGVEPDFSQALVAAGYSPTGVDQEGKTAPSVLLVGDGTGARQNAEHKFSQPTSFMALRADGWVIIPPMYHWKHRTPWNPLVRDSRAQMHQALERRHILFGPHCTVSATGFPPLVESFRRAKVNQRGNLVEKGNFQHGPDGVRYLAWRFLPRPKPPAPAPFDHATFDAFRRIRLFDGP